MTSKYAYVWLVMIGDRYAPGVIVSAYSCKKNSIIKCDCICMVTNDVTKTCIKEMEKVFDKIIVIDYIKTKSKKLMTQKQRNRYESWIDISYTKWAMLQFDEYEKVLFIDADTVCIQDMSELFKINTPAAVFFNPFGDMIMKKSFVKDYIAEYNGLITSYDMKEVPHGSFVPKNILNKQLHKNGMTINGGLVLLTPNKKDFKSYVHMLGEFEEFGFKSFSGFDEQSIVYFYTFYKNNNHKWYNISRMFNFYIIKEQFKHIKNVHMIHYVGSLLPWESKGDDYDDLIPWNVYCRQAIDNLGLDVTKLNFNKELLAYLETDFKKGVELN